MQYEEMGQKKVS